MRRPGMPHCVALACFLASTLAAALSQAATLEVPTKRYPTIPAAITAARSGDTILVAEGTYEGNFAIDSKSVTLKAARGYRGTILDAGNSGQVLRISAATVSTVVIDGFTIQNGNSAEAGGIYSLNANLTVKNCWIRNNNGNLSQSGGVTTSGAGTVLLENCLFTGNRGGFSQAAYLYGTGAATVRNCTFTGNSDNGSWAAVAVFRGPTTVVNTIIWGNPCLSINALTGSTLTVSYSDIQRSDFVVWPGVGNIHADPMFLGLEDGRIAGTSPCVDAGTNVSAPAFDLAGTSRPQDGNADGNAVTDQGALEFPSYCAY